MTLAATFLGGAKSRLLPPSIPFRFFVVAAVAHVLMWLVLLINAGEAVRFGGGVSATLAGVHLLALGVLVTTAIGASAQLLPVATRRALAAVWPIKLVFWLTIPGMTALIAGMYVAHAGVLLAGAISTAGGLLVFCILLADNLRRARALGIVAAYGWTALAALVLLVTFGVALAIDDRFGFLADHRAVALAHLILGGFGFMGLLALGFSHILIPMFALAMSPSGGRLAYGLATTAIMLGTLGALAHSSALLTIATLSGFASAACHVRQMMTVLQAGMRKRLGLSFVLVRAAWLILLATPLAGLAALHGWAGPNGPTLFGFLLFSWLLTFLLGILQRILPFLASMHAGGPGGTMPLMSDLAGSTSLKVHAVCHVAALCGLAAAIIADVAWLMQAGAAVGFIGALAFAWFAGGITIKLLKAGAAMRAPAA